MNHIIFNTYIYLFSNASRNPDIELWEAASVVSFQGFDAGIGV